MPHFDLRPVSTVRAGQLVKLGPGDPLRVETIIDGFKTVRKLVFEGTGPKRDRTATYSLDAKVQVQADFDPSKLFGDVWFAEDSGEWCVAVWRAVGYDGDTGRTRVEELGTFTHADKSTAISAAVAAHGSLSICHC